MKRKNEPYPRYYVYLVKSPLHPESNGYVGKSFNPELRLEDHKAAARKGDDNHFHLEMRKYGIDSFKIVKILSSHKTDLASRKNEIKMIAKLNTFKPNGYNTTRGGDGTSGHVQSAKQRADTGNLHRGKIVSKETRKLLSKNHKPTFQTEETRARMRIAQAKRPPCKESTKEKRRAYWTAKQRKIHGEKNKGIIFSKKRRENMSKASKLREAKRRGWKHTPETLEKMKISNKKNWIKRKRTYGPSGRK